MTRPDVRRGVEWGENVANQILAWRATDGFSDPVVPFTGAGAIVGQWESATGTSMSAGNMAFTAPFVLTSNTQFQSAFPRPWATLVGPEFAADYNEVATMGVKSGSDGPWIRPKSHFSSTVTPRTTTSRRRFRSPASTEPRAAIIRASLPAHDCHARHYGDRVSRQARLRDEFFRTHLAADRRSAEGGSRRQRGYRTGSPTGFRSSRRRITRSIQPRIRRHTARAPACSSTSSVIATRSSSTPRSTPSSPGLPREESSRGVTRAYDHGPGRH